MDFRDEIIRLEISRKTHVALEIILYTTFLIAFAVKSPWEHMGQKREAPINLFQPRIIIL